MNFCKQTIGEGAVSNRLVSQLMQGFAEGMEALRFSFSLLIPHQLPLSEKTNVSLVKKKYPRLCGKGKANALFNQKSSISKLWDLSCYCCGLCLLIHFQRLCD